MRRPSKKVIKRTFKYTGLLVLVGFVVFWFWILPWGIKNQLERATAGRCKSCHLDIGTLSFGILPRVTLTDVKFVGGDPNISEFRGQARRIVLTIAPLRLFFGRFHFKDIELEGLAIKVINGDGHSPPAKPATNEESSIFTFEVERAHCTEAEFAYVRVLKGVPATLSIHAITGELGELGSVTELLTKRVKAQFHARFENSGEINVGISTYLFKRPLEVDVTAKVQRQNLADLTTFFQKNDGLVFKGEVVDGLGTVHLHDRKLSATVDVRYKDFDVHFDRTDDRGGGAAAFMNFGKHLTMDPNNLDEKARDQVKTVELERGDESLVSFILRGLKEAALKVVTSPQT